MTPVIVNEGTSPVILAFPHGGIQCSDDIEERLNANGKELADTDWHIHRLYDGLLPETTTVQATFHRYVVDANRSPDDQSLYPGQNTTGLCPVTDFNGHAIWKEGREPNSEEITERRENFHRPYHEALAAQMERIKNRHGIALLYDCHSIRSRIEHLFDGVLPDFNIGTNDGKTCAAAFEDAVVSTCQKADGFSHTLNGRFKGGWTTRHYGNPKTDIHALQMELSQSTYMVEHAPWTFDDKKAARLRPHLKAILTKLESLALEGAISTGDPDERSSS